MSQKFSGPPLKEQITDFQLGPILAILRELQPFILEPVLEQGGTPTDPAIDGGVKSSAASTFIRACSRIDSILGDEARWTLKSRDTLVQELIKTQKAQRKFIEVQEQSSLMLQAPHYVLRPTLAITGGRYVAYFGSLTEAGQAIVGQGDTPNEALDDFDDAFNRTPNEQIFLIAEKQGVDLKPKSDDK